MLGSVALEFEQATSCDASRTMDKPVRNVRKDGFRPQASGISCGSISLVVGLRRSNDGAQSNDSQRTSKSSRQGCETKQKQVCDAKPQQRQGEWVGKFVCAGPQDEPVHKKSAELTASDPEDQQTQVYPPSYSSAEQELANATLLEDALCDTPVASHVIFCNQWLALGDIAHLIFLVIF